MFLNSNNRSLKTENFENCSVVGLLVSRSVCHNFPKGGKLHFHLSIVPVKSSVGIIIIMIIKHDEKNYLEILVWRCVVA